MRFPDIVIGAALLCALAAPAAADTLVLTNNDRITGKVVDMELGKLEFKSDLAGTLKIDWDKVKALTTSRKLEAFLRDGSTVQGKAVVCPDGALSLQPEDAAACPAVPMAQVRTLKEIKPNHVWELDGNVNLGYSQTSGNTETENFNLAGKLVTWYRPHRGTLRAEANRSSNRGNENTNNDLASLKYDRFLTRQWYAYAFGQWYRDKFKDLDAQWQGSVGLGYQFWRSRRRSLYIEAGPGYITESYINATREDRDFTIMRWAADLSYYIWYKKIEFYHYQEGFVDLGDSGEYSLRTRTGFRFPLVDDLSFYIQYNWDYDNQPATGKDGTDEKTLVGLGYKF